MNSDSWWIYPAAVAAGLITLGTVLHFARRCCCRRRKRRANAPGHLRLPSTVGEAAPTIAPWNAPRPRMDPSGAAPGSRRANSHHRAQQPSMTQLPAPSPPPRSATFSHHRAGSRSGPGMQQRRARALQRSRSAATVLPTPLTPEFSATHHPLPDTHYAYPQPDAHPHPEAHYAYSGYPDTQMGPLPPSPTTSESERSEFSSSVHTHSASTHGLIPHAAPYAYGQSTPHGYNLPQAHGLAPPRLIQPDADAVVLRSPRAHSPPPYSFVEVPGGHMLEGPGRLAGLVGRASPLPDYTPMRGSLDGGNARAMYFPQMHTF